MKICSTCKNFLYCDHYCNGINYEPSLRKLMFRKIKLKIMRFLNI